MAGAAFPVQRRQTLQRDFEFSRLHEEWIVSVYALVVPGRDASRSEQSSCGPHRADELRSPKRSDRAERRAG